eukprot:scaffold4324_cov57-Phaeocystis_antarctica.AAC.7
MLRVPATRPRRVLGRLVLGRLFPDEGDHRPVYHVRSRRPRKPHHLSTLRADLYGHMVMGPTPCCAVL